MIKSKLTIAQLSDIHIGGGSDFVQGIDVRENFREALYSPSVDKADLVFLSGDLTDDGSLDGYEFVKREMERRNKPWRFILGNHDDFTNCFKVLDKGVECPFENTYDYTFEFNGYNFICLDTANGNVSENQKVWLVEQAAKVKGEVFLITHYPPCICGHKFMDSHHSMIDPDGFQKLLATIKNLNTIFCGHYHTQFDIKLPSGQAVYVAPPTQMQIDPQQENFFLKTSRPAWQLIHFGENSLQVEQFAL